MEQIEVQFAWLEPQATGDLELPRYHSELASGMDVAAAVLEPVVIAPGEIRLIATGFAVALPPGFELQVRPRSGMATRHGITVVNAPGTIDADYRGEIRIGLVNLGRERFTIHRGDRIAQLVLAPVCQARLRLVAGLAQTDRGSGGFGHTGIKS
ncbi:MAG TPA: dUTP diphosphatase [Desulfobulbaceae bacterium]|jgi:dUTP pyrophosphatase|nr:dUTP diphosphatase [Desulfobulbaceae bacterium]